MNSWFSNSDRRGALHSSALSWIGTPFYANSSEKGRGVSCQKLVAAIYRESGFAEIDVPNVPMSHARFSRGESLVEKFIAKREDFFIVEAPEVGDLIGFRLGKTIHHLGICLGTGEFVHALHGAGVTISQFSDPTWMTRLARIWRPMA